MTKVNIETPPGTGYKGRLTLEQKALLKQMWTVVCQTTEADAITTVKKKRLEIFKVAAPPSKESTTETAEADNRGRAMTGMEIREVLFDSVLGGHHDLLLLRFLRTNGWDLERAKVVFFKALRWRSEFGVSELSRLSEDELDRKYPGFKKQLEMCKVRVHGKDRMGRVVVYIICKLHKIKAQPRSSMEKFTVYMLETVRLLIHPLDEACVIFDLRGSGLASMDIGIIQFYSHCMRYYYPESVSHCVILDPGRAFQGIWKLVRSWANPRLVSRIQFARHETDLLKYIDADHLLDSFGGKLSSKTTDYVGEIAGENDRMKDVATRDRLTQKWRTQLWKLEALLREWVSCQESETKDTRAEAVIEADLEQVAKDIRVAYFKMRPYIRAKTMHDRLEHRPLQDDGTVEWTYPHV